VSSVANFSFDSHLRWIMVYHSSLEYSIVSDERFDSRNNHLACTALKILISEIFDYQVSFSRKRKLNPRVSNDKRTVVPSHLSNKKKLDKR
jgi:hypothetical protein